MKASPHEQQKLLKLQQLDLQLTRIARDMKALEHNDELDTAQGQLGEILSRVAESQHVVDDARAELAKSESDIQLVDDRLARNTKLMEGNLNARDSQSVEAEVISLVARKEMLENTQLELLQNLEDAEERHRAVLQEETALEAFIAGLDDRKAEAQATFEQERATVLEQRSGQVADLLPELYELYERQRERFGYGASELRGRHSTIVGVELSAEDLSKIASTAPDEVVLCPESQAILVRAGATE